MVTNAVNNTEVVCTGLSSSDTTTIRIAGKLTQAMITCNRVNLYDFVSADEPSPPQNLSIRSVEHHSNYSTVVVMWELASNDSRVDFYQYQLINSLTEVRVSNTTNTTAILSGVPYNVNISADMSFVISAYNCERAGEQATLLIIFAGKYDIQLHSFI